MILLRTHCFIFYFYKYSLIPQIISTTLFSKWEWADIANKKLILGRKHLIFIWNYQVFKNHLMEKQSVIFELFVQDHQWLFVLLRMILDAKNKFLIKPCFSHNRRSRDKQRFSGWKMSSGTQVVPRCSPTLVLASFLSC